MLQSAKVRDFMATRLVVLSPDQQVLSAMRIMLEHRISGAPVVDAHGSLVGVLTQRDCLSVAFQASYHGDAAGRVAQYMTPEVETVPADMALVEVIEKFYRSQRRRFPVMQGNQLVGQISRRDVLRAVLEA
jgi:CBS domain-containing protein